MDQNCNDHGCCLQAVREINKRAALEASITKPDTAKMRADNRKVAEYQAEADIMMAASAPLGGAWSGSVPTNGCSTEQAMGKLAQGYPPRSPIDYTGQIVFIEQVSRAYDNDKDKSMQGYYNGEYFVLTHTPNSIYVVKAGADVYEWGSSPKQLSLVGEKRYVVVTATAPIGYGSIELLRAVYHKACAVDRGEKLSWGEGTYRAAKMALERIAERFNFSLVVFQFNDLKSQTPQTPAGQNLLQLLVKRVAIVEASNRALVSRVTMLEDKNATLACRLEALTMKIIAASAGFTNTIKNA